MIIPKSQLVSNINSEIVDNANGQISPYDVRHNLIDLIDSVHLLLEDRSIQSLNLATPSTRSVKIGDKTLENINLENYYSIDNVAIGYSALRSNYQGERNTAVGSLSLSCNIYGHSNVALGSKSLGGNTTGIGNIGIGSNTLINNKIGNFNIAIGNSAGYYATRNTSYKLFIASHPVESEYICDNPLGSGLTPLVFGDLNQSSLRFGIAVNSLHSASTLQVSGGISPSINSYDNLGDQNYRFKNLYLTTDISFPNNKQVRYIEDKFVVNTSLIPSGNRECDLGASGYQWKSGHFYDIYVSGTAYIENYVRNTISDCLYECKTLYLASSGDCNLSNGCGYLNDQQLEGAGFIVNSSGVSYLRNYFFTFQPSGNEVKYLEENNIYSKSHWKSNISLHLDSSNHIKVNRIVGDKLSLLTNASGYGLFINNENVYLSREDVIPPLFNSSNGNIAGLGNINFIKSSGSCNDLNFTLGCLESGVNISQKFINGIKQRNKDSLNNNKDKLDGFELKYYDDYGTVYEGGLSDRFVIRSFNDSSEGINNIVLMKDNPNGGVFGINNFTTGGDQLYPRTIFNIRSKDNAVARITAENISGVHSALQLLGGANCLQDGFETIYYHDSGVVDLNLYQDSGRINIYRFVPYQAGLFSSGVTNASLTIGHSGLPVAAISLKDQLFTSSSVVPSFGYGKIYNIKVAKEYANQSHALYFMDASGYTHDLTNNNLDTLDARAIYSEDFVIENAFGGNTYAGHKSPESRLNFANQRTGNTSLGTRSLFSLVSGDYNTAIGLYAGSGITNGYDNLIIGSLAGTHIGSGYKNIVIGNNSFNQTNDIVHDNIILGINIANQHNSNYNLLVGNNNIILISGSVGPNNQDKLLCLPTSGCLQINSFNNEDKLKIKNDSIELYSDTNVYPQNNLKFDFSTPSGTSTLLTLDNSVAPSGSGNYSCSGLPYAELNGNLKLLNSICFSDGSNLNSAKFLQTVDNLENSGIIVNNIFNSLFIEGIANQNINAPSSSSSATTGTIKTRLNNWTVGPDITIKNRDRLLKIEKDDYVIAILINGEYRPIWVSSEVLVCNSCNP